MDCEVFEIYKTCIALVCVCGVYSDRAESLNCDLNCGRVQHDVVELKAYCLKN